jgi:hypothetical protein
VSKLNYSFDLHLHSCLSPYGGEHMTPKNIASVCALAGYDIVALTDYNTCGNSAAFQKAAEAEGLLAVPGMELCLREDAHVICLFPDLERALAFSDMVREKLPQLENNPAVFGEQVLVDENDTVLGNESAFLVGAADIGTYEIIPLVEQYGGVVYPAHLNSDSYSVLANLGLWDPDMGFKLAEVSFDCPDSFCERADLSGLRFIKGCNAHTIDQIPNQEQTMNLPERTAQAVIDWLKK